MLMLWATGSNKSMIARSLRIPRSTVRDWIGRRAGVAQEVEATPLKGEKWGFDSLRQHQHGAYAYVLGLYLGDGCISEYGRQTRLRIFLDVRYPAIVTACAEALRVLLPRHAVGVGRRDGVSIVSSYWKHWPAAIPQHGRGRKHKRPIALRAWQGDIVERYSADFLRGLIHSDGCRGIRRVGRGAYPYYEFSNRSKDIRFLFCWACGLEGVRWRTPSEFVVAVSRRADVARLDSVCARKTGPREVSPRGA